MLLFRTATRSRPVFRATVARLATKNVRGRTIVRDPRKAKRRPPPNQALQEVPKEHENQPQQFQPFIRQDAPPQSFGSSLAQSMIWGAGMALAFIAVGSFFR